MTDQQYSFETQSIHGAAGPDALTLALTAPIYTSTAFQLKKEEDVEGQAVYLYSRIGNPTVDAFEKRIAILEGGIGAVATGTGHAVTMLIAFCLAKAGENFVVSTKLYGGSFQQWDFMFRRLDVTAKFMPDNDPNKWEAAIDDNTKGFFFESTSNPSLDVFDIEALAEVAHKHSVPVIVDNTIGAAGYLVRPIDHGADVVVHSATKWIAGQGQALGGVVISSGKFVFKDNARFPEFNVELPGYEGLVVSDEDDSRALLTKLRWQTLRDFGSSMSPFNARDLIQGLETLHVRVDRHCENAMKLAEWLEAHEDVAWVAYPGLASHPSHALALKYFQRGFGGIVTFALRASAHGQTPGDQALAFVYAVKMCYNAVNLGDVRTLVVSPFHMTQKQLSAESKKLNETTEDGIRVSLGLETFEDIKRDFEQAIAVAVASVPKQPITAKRAGERRFERGT